MKVVFPCCESIVARHSSTCDVYTPTGKLKFTERQMAILAAASCEDGMYLSGHLLRSARKLSRRKLIDLRYGAGVGGKGAQGCTTDRGRAALRALVTR